MVLGEEEKDITPSMHWLMPMTVIEPQPEHGPVLVMIEYRIALEDATGFTCAMQEMGRVRQRDGAFMWNLSCDLADPARYVETFFIESWAEHMRQHERMTIADRVIEDRIRTYLVGDLPPTVFHLISAYEKNIAA